MTERRDSRGCFIKGNVPWNKNLDTPQREMISLVVPSVISTGVLERVQVICPACGQQVEAVAKNGQVKGYCAAAKQYVDFLAETQLAPQSVVRISKPLTAEHRAKIAATLRGRHHSTETKAKISAALTGRHPTAETRTKISAAIIRRHKG